MKTNFEVEHKQRGSDFFFNLQDLIIGAEREIHEHFACECEGCEYRHQLGLIGGVQEVTIEVAQRVDAPVGGDDDPRVADGWWCVGR